MRGTKRSISPISIFVSFWQHRNLIAQLTKREIQGRYKGSLLGLIWALVTPLLMLAIYTYVFSIIFQAKWNGPAGEITNRFYFAISLFAGLIVFNIFAEILGKSSYLMVSNPNYIKKTVFPLEILPIGVIGAALFHALMSLSILLIFCIASQTPVPWTFFFFPIIFIPLVAFCLGLMWIICSLGVYIRDIQHVVALGISVLMFATPVFYSLSAVPKSFQFWVQLNPITHFIDWTRQALILGQLPPLTDYLYGLVGSLFVAWLGYIWFQKTRNGFADVI